MSRPNGRQKRAIENLAVALNECFDAAVEKSTKAAEDAQKVAGEARMVAGEARMVAGEARTAAGEARKAAERAEKAVDGLNVRMDRQDATLRMLWTQCGGQATRHLPIDD